VNKSVFGSLARRATAWVVLIAIAVIALKVVIGVVTGFVIAIASVAVLVLLVVAALWALRRV
jgi:hypothetical protein